MKYLVIEIQKFDTGAMSTPAYAYDSAYQAEAKYHAVLSAAAVSALPVHSCVLINEEGMFIKGECFKHEVEEEEEQSNE